MKKTFSIWLARNEKETQDPKDSGKYSIWLDHPSLHSSGQQDGWYPHVGSLAGYLKSEFKKQYGCTLGHGDCVRFKIRIEVVDNS